MTKSCELRGLRLLHAHAQMVLSQQFPKFIFTGKGNSGEIISCSGVDSNRGLMHCRPLPLPPSQWGSDSSGLQILLLTAAVSVDYSERSWPSGISGESQQTQALQGKYLLYSFS